MFFLRIIFKVTHSCQATFVSLNVLGRLYTGKSRLDGWTECIYIQYMLYRLGSCNCAVRQLTCCRHLKERLQQLTIGCSVNLSRWHFFSVRKFYFLRSGFFRKQLVEFFNKDKKIGLKSTVSAHIVKKIVV